MALGTIGLRPWCRCDRGAGGAAFPLLDLRVDYRDQAVAELMEIYERSQDLWAQQWRDALSELRTLNRMVQPTYEMPRFVS